MKVNQLSDGTTKIKKSQINPKTKKKYSVKFFQDILKLETNLIAFLTSLIRNPLPSKTCS